MTFCRRSLYGTRTLLGKFLHLALSRLWGRCVGVQDHEEHRASPKGNVS